jgi:hypothetical protein
VLLTAAAASAAAPVLLPVLLEGAMPCCRAWAERFVRDVLGEMVCELEVVGEGDSSLERPRETDRRRPSLALLAGPGSVPANLGGESGRPAPTEEPAACCCWGEAVLSRRKRGRKFEKAPPEDEPAWEERGDDMAGADGPANAGLASREEARTRRRRRRR